MLGTKIHKNDFNAETYSQCAKWCNANGCMIVDKGEYYEVVVIPAPSLEELKTAKRNAAGAAFAVKRDEIRYIEISDGNTYGFDCANEDITNFFASWKAAERDGQAPYKVWHNETTKGMIIMQLVDFDTVFDVVRESQIAAYGWYETIAAQIAAATTKEELESIVW